MNLLKSQYFQIGAILLVGIIVAIIIGIGSSKSEQNKTISSGKLEISETNYDFGKIPITGGLVSHEYELTNTSDQPITIKGMKTSCTCTTAVLKYKGKTSPSFGMHNNPAFYSQEIAPGETAIVVATFDPMFHGPTATGNITRTVELYSNAGTKQLKFSAVVTP